MTTKKLKCQVKRKNNTAEQYALLNAIPFLEGTGVQHPFSPVASFCNKTPIRPVTFKPLLSRLFTWSHLMHHTSTTPQQRFDFTSLSSEPSHICHRVPLRRTRIPVRSQPPKETLAPEGQPKPNICTVSNPSFGEGTKDQFLMLSTQAALSLITSTAPGLPRSALQAVGPTQQGEDMTQHIHEITPPWQVRKTARIFHLYQHMETAVTPHKYILTQFSFLIKYQTARLLTQCKPLLSTKLDPKLQSKPSLRRAALKGLSREKRAKSLAGVPT